MTGAAPNPNDLNVGAAPGKISNIEQTNASASLTDPLLKAFNGLKAGSEEIGKALLERFGEPVKKNKGGREWVYANGLTVSVLTGDWSQNAHYPIKRGNWAQLINGATEEPPAIERAPKPDERNVFEELADRQLPKPTPALSVAEIIDQFSTAILQEGFDLPDSIIADGKMHRFRSLKQHKDKAGYYVLHPDWPPSGMYGCWRNNIKKTWTAKGTGDLSPEQRDKLAAQVKAEQAKRQEKLKEQFERVSHNSNLRWDRSPAAPKDHPYLVKKKIKPHFARWDGHYLLIPVMHGDKLWSLQTISPDGEKLFIKGGRKGGCFALFGEPGKVILVAEGFATGASIHEATGECVAIAFDHGNMERVGKALRDLYPSAELIFCADDDFLTKDPHGNLNNPGLTSATKAATLYNVRLAVPAFDEPREDWHVDFNDMAVLYGLDRVRDCIWDAKHKEEPTPRKGKEPDTAELESLDSIVEKTKANPGAPFADNVLSLLARLKRTNPEKWEQTRARLKGQGCRVGELDKAVEKKGKKANAAPTQENGFIGVDPEDPTAEPPPVLANLLVLLKRNPSLCDSFARDEMQRATVVIKPPFDDEPADTFKRRPAKDTDVTKVQEWAQREGLIHLNRDTTKQAIELIAEKRSFHPVKDYLNSLKWDGTKRLNRWLHECLGAEKNEYHSRIGAMFLISMVARIFRPGCQSDHMIVFEGEQGERKSTACRVLAGEWFSDNLPAHLDGKDVSIALRGKWLIELGEMYGMSKADIELVKQFLSRREEQFRPPYGQYEVYEPRQCAFVGTTNQDAYLRDETGARRFWPVKVLLIKIDLLKEWRDQLFAEAVVEFNQGTPWWPDTEFEKDHIKPQQDDRYDADVWEGPIAKWLEGTITKQVTIGDVLKGALDIEPNRQDRTSQNRAMRAMKRLGWGRKKRADGKDKVEWNGDRFWVPSAPTAPAKNEPPRF